MKNIINYNMDYISLLPNDIYYEMCHYLQQIDLITMKYINNSCYRLTKYYIDKFCNNIDTHNLNYIEYCEDNCVIDLIKYIKINGKTVQKQRFTRIYILYNIIKKTIENNDSRLLNYFININPKIAYFDEIIIEASKRQSYIVVKFCLNYPINNINFLLEYAAEYSHNINIVNLLINKGANSVLVLNHALTKACLYQYGDLCALLISKGANECYNGIYFTHNH